MATKVKQKPKPTLDAAMSEYKAKQTKQTWLNRIETVSPKVGKEVRAKLHQFVKNELPGWSVNSLRKAINSYVLAQLEDATHEATRSTFENELRGLRENHDG